MFVNPLSRVSLSILAIVAGTYACETAQAEQPAPVIRTFAFAAQPGFPIPDYLGEDSLALTVVPGSQNFSITFTDQTDPDDRFDDSVWAEAPAHHTTIGGARDEGTRFWLIDENTPTLPPFGAHTFTGPDSPLILFHKTYYILPCSATGACDPGETGKYHFTSGAGIPFVIVTAVFSR